MKMETEELNSIIVERLEEVLGESCAITTEKLADILATTIAMRGHYLYRAIKYLTDVGYSIAVYADGEPVEYNDKNEADHLYEAKAIWELTQAVDEAHLVVFQMGHLESDGWVFVTNCNEENESICDFTCGEDCSFSSILDAWMGDNDD
jgi:hypothetical protein